MKTDFVVQTNSFEGPLDTLLSLIQKRELYINDISLAKVTDDYLNFIVENGDTIHNQIEFVRIASTLVLVKSKSLLPDPDISEDESAEINELEDRLRAYKTMQEKAENLADIFGDSPYFHPKSNNKDYSDIFAPGSTLTKEKLREQAEKCVVSLPKESLPTAEVETKISLDNEIKRLRDRLGRVNSASFSSITHSDQKHHQVVSFVAILELIKEGRVRAKQSDTFAEIHVHTHQS